MNEFSSEQIFEPDPQPGRLATLMQAAGDTLENVRDGFMHIIHPEHRERQQFHMSRRKVGWLLTAALILTIGFGGGMIGTQLAMQADSAMIKIRTNGGLFPKHTQGLPPDPNRPQVFPTSVPPTAKPWFNFDW